MDDQKKHIEMLEMLADKKGYQRGLLKGRLEGIEQAKRFIKEESNMFFSTDVPVFNSLTEYMEHVAKIRAVQREEILAKFEVKS